jgi:hypothetical protein
MSKTKYDLELSKIASESFFEYFKKNSISKISNIDQMRYLKTYVISDYITIKNDDELKDHVKRLSSKLLEITDDKSILSVLAYDSLIENLPVAIEVRTSNEMLKSYIDSREITLEEFKKYSDYPRYSTFTHYVTLETKLSMRTKRDTKKKEYDVKFSKIVSIPFIEYIKINSIPMVDSIDQMRKIARPEMQREISVKNDEELTAYILNLGQEFLDWIKKDERTGQIIAYDPIVNDLPVAIKVETVKERLNKWSEYKEVSPEELIESDKWIADFCEKNTHLITIRANIAIHNSSIY